MRAALGGLLALALALPVALAAQDQPPAPEAATPSLPTLGALPPAIEAAVATPPVIDSAAETAATDSAPRAAPQPNRRPAPAAPALAETAPPKAPRPAAAEPPKSGEPVATRPPLRPAPRPERAEKPEPAAQIASRLAPRKTARPSPRPAETRSAPQPGAEAAPAEAHVAKTAPAPADPAAVTPENPGPSVREIALATLDAAKEPVYSDPADAPFDPAVATRPGSPAAPLASDSPRPRATPPAPRVSTRAEPEIIAMAAVTPAPRAIPPQSAQICGDPRLTGQHISRITSTNRSCGIEAPIRVTSVSGVRLSTPIVVNCRLATRFADWIDDSAAPAAERMGTRLTTLDVYDSYSCRPRNNQRGARISEHGKGNAVDVAGFRFADGRQFTVLGGWRSKAQSGFLRTVHAQACGPFGTVLGPAADRFHQNHFHLDVANYRSGAYCR